jgi:hypothetical protein
MKALIFNHHPDYTHHLLTILTGMGVECRLPTEKATFEAGSRISATVGGGSNFRLFTREYAPEELLPDLGGISFTEQLDGHDLYFTIDQDIAANPRFPGIIWGAVTQYHLQLHPVPPGCVKISSVPHAAHHGAMYLPYFVPALGNSQEKTCITQLINAFRGTPHFEELMELRKRLPVVIAGHEDAPDGIVRDWEILSRTALLVHEKNWGTNCNAVCKALDTGIPVYMSRECRERTGLGDLPDSFFLFSEDHTIEEAYAIAREQDFTEPQHLFRGLRNMEQARPWMEAIIQASLEKRHQPASDQPPPPSPLDPLFQPGSESLQRILEEKNRALREADAVNQDLNDQYRRAMEQLALLTAHPAIGSLITRQPPENSKDLSQTGNSSCE